MESTNNAAKAAEKGSSIKMKKAKFLLTLAMAAAVTSTAAMSFAQWDTLTATAKGTVTLTKPITVTANENISYASNSTDATTGAPVYAGDVVIKVADVPSAQQTGAQLELVPKILDGETPVTDNFTVVVEKAGAVDGTVTEASGKTTDSAPTFDGAGNTYTVKLTPKDTEAAKALADKPLTVQVDATLGTKTVS